MSQMRTMVLEYLPIDDWVVFGVNVGKYSSTMEHMGVLKEKTKRLDKTVFYGFVMLIDWSCLASHAFDSDLKFSLEHLVAE